MAGIDWLNDNGVFLPMINDVTRNTFYHDVISRYCVDKSVIDVGCGTGFLSVMAAKAGARQVLAIEMDKDRALLAKDLISRMGLSDKITVINDDFLNIDQRADICVSETIGRNYFNENIKSIARHAKKLSSGLIPEMVEIKAVAYQCHPLFDIGIIDYDHGQYSFNPGLPNMDDFSFIVNDTIQKNQVIRRGPMGYTGLFQSLPKMPYIKFRELTSNTKLFDISDDSQTQITLNTPAGEEFFFVALFFKSIYKDCEMRSQDTMWHVPLKRMQNVDNDMIISYNDNDNEWWIDY